MIDVRISDDASSNTAKVTEHNQLVVGNLDFSVSIQHDMNVDDTAFNFFKPRSGHIFIITDIIVNATRLITAQGSIVEVYEASDELSTIVNKPLFKFDVARQQVISLPGLNIGITEGEFLSAKCDSDTIFLTICGYFAASQAKRARPSIS